MTEKATSAIDGATLLSEDSAQQIKDWFDTSSEVARKDAKDRPCVMLTISGCAPVLAYLDAVRVSPGSLIIECEFSEIPSGFNSIHYTPSYTFGEEYFILTTDTLLIGFDLSEVSIVRYTFVKD